MHRAGGSTVRLFELFRGPHATLLRFGGEPDGAIVPEYPATRTYSLVGPDVRPRDGQLAAIGSHAFTAYAANPGTRVPIRPDGYLAWRNDG